MPLPQTGTTNARVWECLLGERAVGGVEAAMALGGSAMKEFEEDLGAMEGGVYLLGEDRFEDSTAMRTASRTPPP